MYIALWKNKSAGPLGSKTTANVKSSSGEKLMRQVIVPQMKLGEQAIADIKLDPKSRDDIPQILRGLQHLYTTPELREPIFTILEEVLPARQIEGKTVKADPNNGRPGMTQRAQRACKRCKGQVFARDARDARDARVKSLLDSC